MLRYQFLLSWIVLLGAIGVYSQLQQNTTLDLIDEQGQYEVHKRVTRGDRNQQSKRPNTNLYNKPRASPPDAHYSSTSYGATNPNPSIEFMQQQGQYSAYGQYRRNPPTAHSSSTIKQASQNVASMQKNLQQGNREQQIMKMSRSGFLPLQEKLKDQRDKAASNRH